MSFKWNDGIYSEIPITLFSELISIWIIQLQIWFKHLFIIAGIVFWFKHSSSKEEYYKTKWKYKDTKQNAQFLFHFGISHLVMRTVIQSLWIWASRFEKAWTTQKSKPSAQTDRTPNTKNIRLQFLRFRNIPHIITYVARAMRILGARQSVLFLFIAGFQMGISRLNFVWRWL